MKAQTIIILLVIILVACTPAVTLVPTEMSPPKKLTPTAEVIATVTPSPMPAQPTFAAITPDTIQVERWKEYQAELAKAITCDSGHGCPDYEHALCEWDILGQSDQVVYVWAMCETLHAGNRKPAVIHLKVDGSIQNVKVPVGSSWASDVLGLFPAYVREKIDLYYSPSCPYCGRPEVLRTQLQYRQTHPEEPPLIVLSATPAP